MTLEEAVKKFVKDFSNIPTSLIREVYKNNPEELECLNSEKCFEERPLEYFPAMWGWMFHPDDWTDEEWIKRNIDKVEEIGFIIYEYEHCGILLGINGVGFNFYDAFWTPLYKRRGLKWHDEEVAVEEISTASS